MQKYSRWIIDELINAKKRGIDIRLVLERDNINKKGMRDLVKSGIDIVTDDRSGLMHNKFAILDNKLVWTGSYNLTFNGAYKNNNNAIEIYSKELVHIFLDEFNEMFNDNIFGNRKEYEIFSIFKSKNYCSIENSEIYAYFSPEDNIEDIIIDRLNKAIATIHFLVFSFTSDNIGETLISLHKNGIKIYGIIESIGSNSKYSEYNKLKIEGISVIKDKNKHRMHHKVIIIDGHILITGSFNFSKNANYKNDENIIIINNKEIAGKYMMEFNTLYN